MSISATIARATIVLVAPCGTTPRYRRLVLEAARLVYAKSVRNSDWVCELADARCEDGEQTDHWTVGCTTEIEGGPTLDDPTLEQAIHDRIDEIEESEACALA